MEYIEVFHNYKTTGDLFVNRMRLAACGLDCNECNLYKAEHDVKAAESLVEWFRERGWIEENDDAKTVMKKSPFCKGCWNKTDVHWCNCDCHLLTCCEEKQIDNCGKCSDFPCEKYKEWANNVPHHEKAMEYLLSSK